MPALFPLFRLGIVLATPAARALLESAGVRAESLLRRHIVGNWSEMSEHDQLANAEALTPGEECRVFSRYTTTAGRVWIITEWDRSMTTILLPSEY